MSEAGRGKIAGRSVGEWARAAEALLLLAGFRVALAVVPLRRILRTVARGAATTDEGLEHFQHYCNASWHCHSERSEESPHFARSANHCPIPEKALSERDRAIAVRVRWAVEAAARHSPVRFVCFPQTLAGYAMLRRRGVRSTMVYGVARTAGGELIAHTWLMLGERCVLGGGVTEEYTAIERWG